MRARSLLAAALCLAAAGTAHADGTGSEGSGFGIGAAATLTGVSGPVLAYQTPMFHIEGLLGFHDDDVTTEIDLAGRFFYEVHSTATSDLSIGGGLALVNTDVDPGSSTTDLHLEAGARIRAFLAANLALSATLGLGLIAPDEGDNRVFLGGQLIGSFGVTYFFF